MLIRDILTELTFAGSRCTKDCSGHKAGFRWAMRKGVSAANSNNQSFNNGAAIAGKWQQAGMKTAPKIRNDRGKFAPHPRIP